MPEQLDNIEALLFRIERLLVRMEIKIMRSINEVLTEVQAESTQLDSLSAFVAGLQQQVNDALAGANIPADVQTKIDAVFDAVEANKAKINTALNTTATGAPATVGSAAPLGSAAP